MLGRCLGNISAFPILAGPKSCKSRRNRLSPGSRPRKPNCCGTRLAATQAVERIQFLFRRPSRRLLQHYGSPNDTPGGIQGRHGEFISAVARGQPSSHRDRPTAARGRARGSRPHRQGRTWREGCTASLVRLMCAVNSLAMTPSANRAQWGASYRRSRSR
jgi:hypothetical protein